MRLIDADKLLKEYDRTHKGPAGAARRLIENAPTVYIIIKEFDMISREAALDTIRNIRGTFDGEILLIDKAEAQTELMMLPAAQPPIDEWCYKCKEYDSDRNCCPRFDRIIGKALEDLQSQRMSTLIDLYVRDRHGGRIHRVGDDQHDQLTIDGDGQLRYYNLQCGDGCSTRNDPRSGYEFVPNIDEYGFNMDPREEEKE